jgi:hypothetical protein
VTGAPPPVDAGFDPFGHIPRPRPVTRVTAIPRADPVPDAIWAEAARHYDEPALAALVIAIANINAWNRLFVTTRQVVGKSTG